MKKYLLLVLLTLAFLLYRPLESKAQTLYECYQSKGLVWTSVLDRAVKAAEYGIWGYRGTAEQNNLLASYICSDQLGYSVVTGYEKNLRVSMNSTQTTVPVTSLALKDGTSLTMDKLGDKVFLTIEPGTTREEIVMCTNINTTSINFDPCVRGLAFYGTSTASVAANKKSHNAGSKVVMSNVHYVYEELVDKSDVDTINGVKTFGSFPVIATSTALPTANEQFATKYYVDTVGAGGFTAVNVSSSRGLSVDGSSPEKVGINPSSTLGMAFGSDGSLYQKTNSTLAVEADSNGIKINTSTLVNLIATSTPTANKIPLSTASGTIKETWIATSTTNGNFLRSTSTGAYWASYDTLVGSSTYTVSTAYPSANSTIAQISIPTGTRYAIIKGTGSGSSNGGYGGGKINFGGVQIFPIMSPFTLSDQYGSNEGENFAASITWNTSTIDIYYTMGVNPSVSGGASGSGVIYFYN